jgi:hypothetical protein
MTKNYTLIVHVPLSHADAVREAILATIDELEESINLDGRERPRYINKREHYTIDMLNNMLPTNWLNDGAVIYEYPHLIVAVVVRVLV